MALRLTLKPHERVIVGGAVLRNGGSRVELTVENETPLLRESDVLSPAAVRTPCERIILALQLAYVDAPRRDEHRATYRALAADVHAAAPSLSDLLIEVDADVESGALYRALKRARLLLPRERELLPHAS